MAPKLPKRFQPYADQAQTETAIRYGAQESGIRSLFDTTTRDYGRQSAAQESGFRSLLGELQRAPSRLNQTYTDAGLTPEVRAQFAGTPDGQRLLGQLARDQTAIQQQDIGARSGQQFVQQRMADDYRDDVGQINSSLLSLLKEKGLFEQSALSGLIGEDRANRSKINADARQQAYDADQAIQAQNAAQTNALIGQGLLPGEDGSLQPLPGGKADPDAPGNKPKRTSGPGTASPDAQLSAGKGFSKAVALAKGMVGKKARTPETGDAIADILSSGRPAGSGKVIYEEVPILDVRGQPTGKTKRQPKLEPAKLPNGSPNPRAGQQIVGRDRPATPSFDEPIARAAAEQAVLGYVSTKTVRDLQALGYSVRQIPGLKTQNDMSSERRISRNEAAGPPAPKRPAAKKPGRPAPKSRAG